MNELEQDIRKRLHEQASPAEAPAMFAYMKGIQPFLGIRTPLRRALVQEALRGVPGSEDRWQAVGVLWAAEFREERYAAQDILGRMKLTYADLPRLEGMLAQCDHWDVLDTQIGLLGGVLRSASALRRQRVEAWRVSPHLWTRRAAVLAQLKAKKTTDTALLLETIQAVGHEREFFIQKAIGWALREYAKTDPAWVLEAVDILRLRGLARREALKHLA